MRARLLSLVLALLAFASAQEETFQNPVLRTDFPDPFVLEVDGVYYAYATNSAGKNIQVSRSNDLVNWTLSKDAMPALAPWVRLSRPDVWAPEVLPLDGRFLLYYTARDAASGKQCIGVAISDAPEGRFRDSSETPFLCQLDEGGSIDPSPFRDEDQLYLYWKNDGNCCGMATYIYVQELSPDGLDLVGEPTRLVRNDAAWEGRVVEAPTMWQREDDYYLFFSANSYAGHEYAVGYALCESALGPCRDAPENPILASRMDAEPLVVGPGHQSIVEDSEGETWLVYHVWQVTGGLRGNSRFMWLDRLEWQDDRPVVQGPTIEPQEAP